MIEIINNNAKYLTQYTVALAATLIMFSCSITIGWSSPSLPKLLAADSPVPITSDEGSWIVSVAIVGSSASVLPILFLSNRCGRKTYLLLISVPLLIGWILIVVARSVAILIVARLIIGFAYGCSLPMTPIYLAEISSSHIRGALTNLSMIMQQCAIVYAFAIGPYVSIATMAYISMIPIFLFLALFIWCPETPYYLIKIDNRNDAAKNLAKLRGCSCDSDIVQKELSEISATIAKSQVTDLGTVKEMLLPKNRKNLLLVIVLASIRHLCGSHSVLIYAETLFDRVGSSFSGSTASIIMAVVQLVTCIVSSSLVDRLGRRRLLLFSLMSVLACNVILTIYFFVGRFDNVQSAAIFIVAVIIVSNSCYTMGIALIPPIIFGEIFPQNLKPVASTFYVITASLSGLLMLKLFQIFSDNFGTDCIFLLFSICICVCLPYFWQCLPETMGKSLSQIQED